MIANTHRNGFLGLFIGGSALIIATVGSLFKLVSEPTFLLSLYWAISDVRHQRTSSADIQVFCALAAAVFGVLGAFVVAFLLSYFGMPYTVQSSASTDAAAPTPPR